MSIQNRIERYSSLKSGKLSEYFGHLLIEIFLVMIGILLALQVSNWNEARVNDDKEHKMIHDLREEFLMNRDRILMKQQTREKVANRLQIYIASISKGTSDYDDFMAFHGQEYFVGFTNPSLGVIETLVSSGQLVLITNDTLKYLLADWKDQIKNLYENEQILWNTTIEYQRIFHSLMPDPKESWNDITFEEKEQLFTAMKKTISYRNALTSYNGAQNAVIDECSDIIESMNIIIDLLEREEKNT